MWWHFFYDETTLKSAFHEHSAVWGPGRPDFSAWAPAWSMNHAESITWIVALCIAFTVVRMVCFRFLLYPFARKHVIAAGYSENEVTKFCESSWRLLFYSLSSVAVIRLVLKQEYFYHPWKMWFVGELPGEELVLLYNVQMGWYAHQVFTHLVLDEKKKDFWVMLFHHFLTLALLYLSLAVGYYRIGLLVLFAHDPCDPFLEAAKAFNYLHAQIPCVAAFALLIISWIILRLMFFPTLVYSGFFEAKNVIGNDMPGYWLFGSLLLLLQSLHIYWFMLIVKIAGKYASTKGPIAPGQDWDSREVKQQKQN